MIGMLEACYQFADRSRIFRRAVLYVGVGINIYAFKWAMDYANNTIEHPELATAGVIAAILTPATGLLGAIFKFYNDGRAKCSDSAPSPPSS